MSDCGHLLPGLIFFFFSFKQKVFEGFRIENHPHLILGIFGFMQNLARHIKRCGLSLSIPSQVNVSVKDIKVKKDEIKKPPP